VHDSGIVDLKGIASTDPGAEERAKTTPLASAGLFDDEHDNPSIPPPPSQSTGAIPSSVKPAVAAPVAAVAKTQVSRPSPAKKSSILMPVLGGLTIAAIAAAVMVVARPKPPPPPAAPAAPVQVAPPAPTPEPSPAPAVVASASPAADPAPAVDPDPSPAASGEPAKPPPASIAAGLGRTPKPTPSPKKDEAPGGSTVSGLSAMMAQATNSPAAAPLSAGALGEAVQHAVGDQGATPAPAAPAAADPGFAPGSVPQKPSQGAVTGALGRVLPQARSCLNPDDPISRANITFASAGTVSSVVVSGFAAGKPSEECIKSALAKATVPPFAQANYAANVTIRPN
jgi:hypothetical protein